MTSHRPLQAQGIGQNLHDTDGDGLSDALELYHKISPCVVDTDGDGWSDTEEFARHSNPGEPQFNPPPNPQHLRVSAYMRGGMLHLAMAVYSQDGFLADDAFALWLLADGNLVQIPPALLSMRSTYREFPTKEPGEFLAVIDWPVDASLIYRTGTLSALVTLDRGSGNYLAADAIDLQAYESIVTQRVLIERGGGDDGESFAGTGPSSVSVPLGGQGAPDSWVLGSVCYQSMAPAGQSGAVVTLEVTDADCQDGWDGYCSPPACAGTVGGTVDSIDPAILIGG